MSSSEIALICVCVVLAVVIFAWIGTFVRQKRKDKDKKVGDYVVIDGVRYTKDETVVNDDGEAKLSLKKGDIMLERGKEYKVGKDLLPGKYTVLTADENSESVSMRIGGLVKDYKHFTSVMLTEGDTISAVSWNVILR